MHIVVLADAVDNQNAGIHVYTKKLIENLLKIDKKNRYTFIHCEDNEFFKGKEHHIVRKKKGKGRSTARRAWHLPKLIRELNPDILWEPCHIPPYRIPGHIKTVVTIHDLTPVLFPEFHTFRGKTIHKLFLRKILKAADLILTPSKTTKRDIRKIYSPDTAIEVTTLGIDKPNMKAHRPKTKPPHHITLGAPHQPYILSLGTLEPRKNLEMLIDVFLELKMDHQIPHKLVLAGAKGWKNKRLLAKTAHPDIVVTGHITEGEKASYYRHADMFVYPSIYEGFGLPPLEAMSYGIPVVCSTGGSLKEIFGNHSLSFKPTDAAALKKNILSLTSSKSPSQKLRKKLVEEGKAYSNKFTWKRTAEKTLKAFKNIS
ncbi:glycosyltransferase family 4 protein [Candidatus Peregrinibacteria bacterium]|jgi:glycosyltransferase involved in cell wall biosynthesis|nr:glycosyltransferase family 4 protein [Candidatus Peregrinibacteria bacterium]MBT7702770.1 glycosyltransferase family 4 protein [Candidatus Peregrinibacteria bacterium]